MGKLGSRSDQRTEAERPERSAVVGHQGDRHDLAGVGIGEMLNRWDGSHESLRPGLSRAGTGGRRCLWLNQAVSAPSSQRAKLPGSCLPCR